MTPNQNGSVDTVLVTGSSLSKDAVGLLEAEGIRVVFADTDPPRDQLCELSRNHAIKGLIVRQGSIDRAVLEASPDLRVVANHGAGYDNIDIGAAKALNIPVFVAYGRNARSVAEQAMAMLLALLKALPQLDRSVRDGTWNTGGHLPGEFSGKTLGIAGFGSIGRELAKLASPYGGRILFHDQLLDLSQEATGVERADNLDQLLASSDVVSLHLPLTDETRGFFDRQRISRMKRGAILINTARGAIVDEEALVEALVSGHLSGAGLDTFAVEPLPAHHKLCALPNVVLSPHVGGVTGESVARMGVSAAQNVLSVLRGHPENPKDRL